MECVLSKLKTDGAMVRVVIRMFVKIKKKKKKKRKQIYISFHLNLRV